jgi:hypothetical protein
MDATATATLATLKSMADTCLALRATDIERARVALLDYDYDGARWLYKKAEQWDLQCDSFIFTAAAYRMAVLARR